MRKLSRTPARKNVSDSLFSRSRTKLDFRHVHAGTMQPVLYIIAIAAVGSFMFWVVNKHDRGRVAMLLKIAIIGVSFAAILPRLLSLMR